MQIELTSQSFKRAMESHEETLFRQIKIDQVKGIFCEPRSGCKEGGTIVHCIFVYVLTLMSR